MTRYYTVDRASALSEGALVGLVRYDDVHPPELQAHLDELFPDGVTLHGEKYFVSANSTARVTSPAIELIWENVRRAHFAYAPSRMQSAFATATLEEAQRFRDAHGPSSPIFEVDAAEAFHADMNLLHSHTSALVTSHIAQLYWSQKPGSADPFWECLLRPPVRVGRRVL